jgi:hypothetical protein
LEPVKPNKDELLKKLVSSAAAAAAKEDPALLREKRLRGVIEALLRRFPGLSLRSFKAEQDLFKVEIQCAGEAPANLQDHPKIIADLEGGLARAGFRLNEHSGNPEAGLVLSISDLSQKLN